MKVCAVIFFKYQNTDNIHRTQNAHSYFLHSITIISPTLNEKRIVMFSLIYYTNIRDMFCYRISQLGLYFASQLLHWIWIMGLKKDDSSAIQCSFFNLLNILLSEIPFVVVDAYSKSWHGETNGKRWCLFLWNVFHFSEKYKKKVNGMNEWRYQLNWTMVGEKCQYLDSESIKSLHKIASPWSVAVPIFE